MRYPFIHKGQKTPGEPEEASHKKYPTGILKGQPFFYGAKAIVAGEMNIPSSGMLGPKIQKKT